MLLAFLARPDPPAGLLGVSRIADLAMFRWPAGPPAPTASQCVETYAQNHNIWYNATPL